MCPCSVKLYVFSWAHYIMMMVWLSSSHSPATIKVAPHVWVSGKGNNAYILHIYTTFVFVCVRYRCTNSRRAPSEMKRGTYIVNTGWQLFVKSVVIIGSLKCSYFFTFRFNVCVWGHPVIFTWTSKQCTGVSGK